MLYCHDLPHDSTTITYSIKDSLVLVSYTPLRIEIYIVITGSNTFHVKHFGTDISGAKWSTKLKMERTMVRKMVAKRHPKE